MSGKKCQIYLMKHGHHIFLSFFRDNSFITSILTQGTEIKPRLKSARKERRKGKYMRQINQIWKLA